MTGPEAEQIWAAAAAEVQTYGREARFRVPAKTKSRVRNLLNKFYKARIRIAQGDENHPLFRLKISVESIDGIFALRFHHKYPYGEFSDAGFSLRRATPKPAFSP
jgi:hypothetical protein